MKALSILLLASVCAFGQKPCVGGEHPNNAPDCIPAAQYFTKPLKCGKYERVQKGHSAYCHSQLCTDSVACTTIAICEDAKPDSCAPIMHEVTEAQWQAAVDSIRLLTKLIDNQQKQIDAIVKAVEKPKPEEKKEEKKSGYKFGASGTGIEPQ